jgi:hypothetical protein
LLALLISGCASIPEGVKDVATSPETFAVCKTADVITTAVALNSGNFVEANPLLKGLIGPHNIFPLVAISVAMYLIIKHFNEPKLTLAANAITCGVAAHNLILLH